MVLKWTRFLFFAGVFCGLSLSLLYEQTLLGSQDCIFTHTQRQDPTCYCVTVLSDTLFILRSFWFCGRWRSGLWHCATQSPNLSSYFNRQRFQRPLYMHPHESGRLGEREREREEQSLQWDWMEDRKNPKPITQITLCCNLSYRSHWHLWGWLKGSGIYSQLHNKFSSFTLSSASLKVCSPVLLLLLTLIYPGSTMKCNCWQCDQSKCFVHLEKPQARAVPFGCVYVPPVSYVFFFFSTQTRLYRLESQRWRNSIITCRRCQILLLRGMKRNLYCNKSVRMKRNNNHNNKNPELSQGGWTCWSCRNWSWTPISFGARWCDQQLNRNISQYQCLLNTHTNPWPQTFFCNSLDTVWLCSVERIN